MLDIVSVVADVMLLVLFFALTVTISQADLRTGKIPPGVLFPGTLASLACIIASTITTSDAALEHLLNVAIGGVGLVLVFLILIVIAPGRMGIGDAKLAFLIGLVVTHVGGPVALIVATGAMFVVGALWSVIHTRRSLPRSTIPFAPSMFIGAWVSIIGSLVMATLDWI